MISDKSRMLHWLVIAAMFYALTVFLGGLPTVQTVMMKAGNVCFGAFLGYWADRHLFGRLVDAATHARIIARAIVVAAAIAGIGLGL